MLGTARVQCYDLGGVRPRSPEEISLHTEAGGSAPPDAFGPFRVLHQIGAGALGPVFRAYDPGQDKLVAVKLFRADLPPERVHELVADFERLIAADLTHSSIVAAVATGIVQVSPYLAQDFVAADSLDTVLREHGPAPTGEGLRIVTQIAGGLDYAAVVGIVHGALHPRDVLISPDDVRLTGIGVARALDRVGVQAPLRRPYAAPERLEGGAWDRRADVFTLGALAHELIWGRRITALGAEAAAGLSELPGAQLNRLRDTFARALAENPGQRFPTALEFADSLRNCFVESQVLRPSTPLGAGPSTSLGAGPSTPLGAGPSTSLGAGPSTSLGAGPSTSLGPGASTVRPAADYPRLPMDGVRPRSVSTAAPLLPLVGDEKAPERPLPEFEAPEIEEPKVEEPKAGILRNGVEPEEYIDHTGATQKVETLADLALRGAEPSESPQNEPARNEVEPPVRVEPPARLERIEHPISLAPPEHLSPARSAVWPLSLALLVGVALGFAGGYWLGQSDQRQEQRSAASADRPALAETEVPLRTEPAPSAVTPATAPPPVTEAPAAAPPVAVPPAAVPPATGRPEAAPPPVKPAAPKPAPPARPASPAPRPAESATVAQTGRITVRTTPAGARVTIDGKDVGKSPLTVPDLQRGTHTVRVMRDGYTTVERRVVITPSQPASTLTLNLTRSVAPAESESRPAQTASLTIESRPSGATVMIDGKRVGTTPLALPGISIGTHAVRLEMAGYKPWTASVPVVSGEKNRVAASLEQ